MRRIVSLLAAAMAAAFFPVPASAQTGRTFVSGLGSDANACSRSAPCRTFTKAIGLTNAGGEIIVLDTAGYGPFTINKSISITAVGVEAAITAPAGGTGISITAGADDVVNLKSLVISGAYNGANGDTSSVGISFSGGTRLVIQNCVVRNFAFAGIQVQSGVVQGQSEASNISITDTILSNNGTYGLRFAPTGPVTLSLERVQALGNKIGLQVVNTATSGVTLTASANDSAFVGNSDTGVVATGAGASTAVTLSNSQIAFNTTGVRASAATINLAQNMLFGNGTGFNATGGTIKSFRTSAVANGNYVLDTTNSGTLTPAAPQ